ncbi:hypothetical protein GGR52DRAFT_148146 [Hypoxylon sp. FL1284]|nr:hypothetical protein GGR52DRAFT_148146 [Hypoxylon sp. FL1284]
MIVAAWSFVQQRSPCPGGFIAAIDPPSALRRTYLGCSGALRRISRRRVPGWALWAAGRWLSLPRSNGRYLPCSYPVRRGYLQGRRVSSWGLYAAPATLLGLPCAADQRPGKRRGENWKAPLACPGLQRSMTPARHPRGVHLSSGVAVTNSSALPAARMAVPSAYDSYLVDSASSHMLVLKIKPCMSKYKQIYTAKLRMAH